MKPLRYITVAVSLTVMLMGGGPSVAQTPEEQPVLPDIAPREFEIRGEMEIAFPSLRRQPLIGFNPPPQIYEVPRDRRPYMEDYKQAAADLGTTPLGQPAPPPVSSLIGGENNRGQVEVGAGRYLSRVGRAWLNLPMGGRSTFQSTLDYEGSNGHHPFPGQSDLNAHYNSFRGDIGINTNQRLFTLGLALDGHSDEYVMYGAEQRSTFNSNLYNPNPDRRGYGFGATLSFSTKDLTGAPLQTRIRYGNARYDTEMLVDPEADDPRFSQTQKLLDVHSELRIPFDFGRLRVGGNVTTGGLGVSQLVGSDHLTYDAGGDVRFLLQDIFHVTLGGRVVGFTTSDRNGLAEQKLYPSPLVEIDLYPVQTLHVYAKNIPRATPNDLVSMMRENPYTRDRPILQPTVATVDAQGGASLYARPLRISGHAGLQILPNYLFFERASAPYAQNYEEGFFDALYGSARILHFGGDVSMYFSSVFSANIQGRYRVGRLTDGPETSIPHFAPITASTSLSYRFAHNRGLFRITGGYEGARYIDRAETEELDAFIDLGVFTSYNFTPGLGAFVQMNNISSGNFERWKNYPEATWIALGGVRFNW